MKSLCKLTSDGSGENTKLVVNNTAVPISSATFHISTEKVGTITAEIALGEIDAVAKGFLIVVMPDGTKQKIKQIVLDDGTILE